MPAHGDAVGQPTMPDGWETLYHAWVRPAGPSPSIITVGSCSTHCRYREPSSSASWARAAGQRGLRPGQSVPPRDLRQQAHLRALVVDHLRLRDRLPVAPVLGHLVRPAGNSGFGSQKSYLVQTSPKVVERCILMASDPSDLVFDPAANQTLVLGLRTRAAYVTYEVPLLSGGIWVEPLLGSPSPGFLPTVAW